MFCHITQILWCYIVRIQAPFKEWRSSYKGMGAVPRSLHPPFATWKCWSRAGLCWGPFFCHPLLCYHDRHTRRRRRKSYCMSWSGADTHSGVGGRWCGSRSCYSFTGSANGGGDGADKQATRQVAVSAGKSAIGMGSPPSPRICWLIHLSLSNAVCRLLYIKICILIESYHIFQEHFSHSQIKKKFIGFRSILNL